MSEHLDGSDRAGTEANVSTRTDARQTTDRAPDPTAHAAQVAAPETTGLVERPIEPDYPRYRVAPGTNLVLRAYNPDDTVLYRKKKDVREELARQRARIAELQARLYAEQKQSLLVVLQAMDTGGKDGAIRGVFQGVNPQGCQVWSFKAPSSEELAHHFLWRYDLKMPPRGMITIFNRSHYEDVLIVRVKQMIPEDVWQQRYQMINEFEHMATLNNTTIVKFFLYITKDEQQRRLEARLRDPAKHWKFSSSDLKERAFWDQYHLAFEDAISNCSTEYAPWYVVPANKKWYRDLVIARTIADTLTVMNPRYPAAEVGLDTIIVPEWQPVRRQVRGPRHRYPASGYAHEPWTLIRVMSNAL